VVIVFRSGYGIPPISEGSELVRIILTTGNSGVDSELIRLVFPVPGTEYMPKGTDGVINGISALISQL
jgi:hypothetical protein